MWAEIGTLIMATSLIQLANGFFGTFISLRVAIEDFGPTMSGLVLSSYFAGFTLGASRCERIIERVGHIRAYAAFAGLVVAATALMPLRVGPLPWLTLRAAVGFGCAGLFVATESWLNAKAEPAQRGRVFSAYMFGTFLALALGQLLIGWAKIETAGPFNAIVALFAAALVMVSTTRAEPPRGTASAALPFGQLFRAAPVAVVGCLMAGLVSAAFYALVPAWMQDEGIGRDTIAIFMLVAVLGGLAFQVPVGRLSDRFDRQIVLAALSLGFAGAAIALVNLPHSPSVVFSVAALLGGFMSTLIPGLCRRRARSYAGRSDCCGKRTAHPDQRAGLHCRPADWHKRDGSFQHRRPSLLYGRRGPALGPGRHSSPLGESAPDTSRANLRDPDAAGGPARARFAWSRRRIFIAAVVEAAA
jgi:MFS family permease